jgi:hypothetical protein
VGIGIYIKDGGMAEQISFSNCSIETIRDIDVVTDSLKNAVYPIFVDIEKRQNESKIGSVRDLTFADIDIVSDNGILIQGMSKSKIENLTMRNITVRVDRGFDYSKRKKHTGGKTSETEDRRVTIYAQKPSYITLANIDGLSVDGLRVFVPEDVFSKYNRSALLLYEVDTGTIGDVLRRPDGTGSQMPVVVAENCRNTSLPK